MFRIIVNANCVHGCYVRLLILMINTQHNLYMRECVCERVHALPSAQTNHTSTQMMITKQRAVAVNLLNIIIFFFFFSMLLFVHFPCRFDLYRWTWLIFSRSYHQLMVINFKCACFDTTIIIKKEEEEVEKSFDGTIICFE